MGKTSEDTPGRKLFKEWCAANDLKPNKTISDDLVRRIDRLIASLQQTPGA